MFGASAATRRFLRLRRILIGLQVSLLVFSMVVPVGTMAADPSPNPTDNPAATTDPTATPTDPAPPPDATPDPTAIPDPTAAPDPTPAPTSTPDSTPPDATPDATATPDPTADPTASPDPTPTPTLAPVAPYIVTFVAGTSAHAQGDAIAAAGAVDLDSIAVLRMHAIQASDDSVTALRADSSVASVELDRSRAA